MIKNYNLVYNFIAGIEPKKMLFTTSQVKSYIEVSLTTKIHRYSDLNQIDGPSFFI